MVERRIELDRRYSRKKKLRKLKAKLALPGADRAAIILKIRRHSPWWTEAALEQAKGEALPPVPGSATANPNEEPRRKAAPAGPQRPGKKGPS